MQCSFVFEGKLVMAGGYKKDDSFSADGEMCGDVEEYCSKGRNVHFNLHKFPPRI